MIEGNFSFKKMIFPAGEMHIQLLNVQEFDVLNIEWTFQNNTDIIELLLVSDAIQRAGACINKLTIPYVPFGRQDRVAVQGECFSLKVFTDLLNTIHAARVIIYDPHSDVTPVLIKNCVVIPQWAIFAPIINTRFSEWSDAALDAVPYFLISPDGGALKKIYKLSPLLNHCQGIIECSKLRDVKTGAITETKVHDNGFEAKLEESTCVIVDDICDGGRTFIEIAKILKTRYHVKSVVLCVTHGFFTNGLDVFDGLIDEIYTRKGRVK